MKAAFNSAGPELAEFPFERRYFRRPDGLALHYVDEGAGPPVIMVHGNPTWSFFYRRLIAALAPDFRCLAPDHLGMGLSSRPAAGQYGFRLADRAADLAALVRHWGLTEPAHLVVHDWGGPIGLAWAARNPEEVASVTVMNTGTRVPPNYRLPWKLALFKRWAPLGALLAHRRNWFVQGTAAFGAVRKLSPAARRGLTAPYQARENRLAVARFVQDIPLAAHHPSFAFLAETDARLEELLAAKPLALVWGLRDFVFDRTVFLDWRRRFPQAPALVLPEAGHYLMEDEPGRVTAWVRGFLEGLRK